VLSPGSSMKSNLRCCRKLSTVLADLTYKVDQEVELVQCCTHTDRPMSLGRHGTLAGYTPQSQQTPAHMQFGNNGNRITGEQRCMSRMLQEELGGGGGANLAPYVATHNTSGTISCKWTEASHRSSKIRKVWTLPGFPFTFKQKGPRDLRWQAPLQASTSKMLREEVTEADIADIISKWSGIPVTKLVASERSKLLGLSDELHKRVIGQDEAVEAVADAIQRWATPPPPPPHPCQLWFVWIATDEKLARRWSKVSLAWVGLWMMVTRGSCGYSLSLTPPPTPSCSHQIWIGRRCLASFSEFRAKLF